MEEELGYIVEKQISDKIKGYLCYKTILCHKVAFDVQVMNFFIWRKNNVTFLRYRDFCVFVKFANFKTCDVNKHCSVIEITLMLISFES